MVTGGTDETPAAGYTVGEAVALRVLNPTFDGGRAGVVVLDDPL
jgi:hypothetical protein